MGNSQFDNSQVQNSDRVTADIVKEGTPLNVYSNLNGTPPDENRKSENIGVPPTIVGSRHFVTFSDHFEDSVSCFANIFSTDPHNITLDKWINACTNPQSQFALEQRDLCLKFRETGNKQIKGAMLAFSPGAEMISRKKELSDTEKRLNVTGWAQFDIDPQHNSHIKDWVNLRDQVSNISYVAFCSLSASGKGVWGLVKVSRPDKYPLHFEQLKRDFASRRIILDPTKGGNPTDLRIYSFDPDAYVADQFRIYDRIYKPMLQKVKSFKQHGIRDNFGKVQSLVKKIQLTRTDLAPDYLTYLRVGLALATEFGESGRSLFHDACSVSPKYKYRDADKDFSSWLKAHNGKITINTFYYLCNCKMN